MKKIILLLFCTPSILLFGASDNEKSVASEIKSVTVFLTGAQVTRAGSVALSPGVVTLAFEGLPQSLQSQSVQVTGTGNFTILSVKHQLNYLKSMKKASDITMIEDSLELLNDNLEFEQSMLEVYTEEKNMIIANKSIGGQDAGVNITNLKETSDFYRTKLTEISKAKLKITKTISDLTDDINRLSYQLSLANTAKNTPSSEVLVAVSVTAQTKAELSISYLVYGTGWTPSYDIRATDISSPVEMYYKANVYQFTGEDWNKVNLTLSTGNPSQSGTKPTLNPWYLTFFTPYEIGRGLYSSEIKAKKEQQKSYDYDEDSYINGNVKESPYEAPAGSSWELTTVNEGQTNVEFAIELPYTIPSDNKQYTVDVQKYTLASTFEYYAAPKLDKDAFLLAKVTGWEQYNLLSGDMNLFFEGTYVGKSYLNSLSTSDTLDISLGRDKNITVNRVKLNNFSSKKIIGLNRKETIAWEISVKNKKKQDVKIVIEDQFPISSDKEIEVESIETGGAVYNAVTGKLSWSLNLKSAESTTMKLTYSVKYPKNKTVNLF